MRGKQALITGATSGIGEACARRLAERGVNLLITGRRRERLEALAAELTKAHGVNVRALVFDICDRAALERALDGVRPELSRLSILINNAGLAKGVDPMQSARLEDWESMIDTNIRGLLQITRFCLPFMIAKGEGHIINLGSVAGRWTYPGGGVYCATKFAVRALSEGLRLDLMGTGLRVTNL